MLLPYITSQNNAYYCLVNCTASNMATIRPTIAIFNTTSHHNYSIIQSTDCIIDLVFRRRLLMAAQAYCVIRPRRNASKFNGLTENLSHESTNYIENSSLANHHLFKTKFTIQMRHARNATVHNSHSS